MKKELTASAPKVMLSGSILLLLMSFQAAAETELSKWKSNATGVCQAALPASAGSVMRMRPLALQNEGASSAFVTCSLPYNDFAHEEPNAEGMGVRLVTTSEAEPIVTCTLVSGIEPATANYVVKSTVIDNIEKAGVIYFFPSDLPGNPATIFAPNISCNIPPGVGVNYVWYWFDRQVGQ